MKKKKWLIPLIIVALFVITFVAGVGTLLSKGYGASTGVYLESNDGVAMLIRDKAPIILSSKHNGDMFTDLDVGDKFFVIHDGIYWKYRCLNPSVCTKQEAGEDKQKKILHLPQALQKDPDSFQ